MTAANKASASESVQMHCAAVANTVTKTVVSIRTDGQSGTVTIQGK